MSEGVFSKRCYCRPWDPMHEPNPQCQYARCDQPATHLLRLKEALYEERLWSCDHLACGRHAHGLDVGAEHDAFALADVYPQFFQPREEKT